MMKTTFEKIQKMDILGRLCILINADELEEYSTDLSDTAMSYIGALNIFRTDKPIEEEEIDEIITYLNDCADFIYYNEEIDKIDKAFRKDFQYIARLLTNLAYYAGE